MHAPLDTRPSLLAGVKAGNLKAKEDFARVYGPFVHGVARKAGLGPEDAEDLAQQVLLELFGILLDLTYDPGRGKFKGLVTKVVRNRVVDFRRRRSVEKQAEEEYADARGDAAGELERLVEREWAKHHLLAALNRIRTEVKPSTFQSFQLHVLEERPVEEVAAALALTAEQVYTNKRRMMARLREHLEDLRRETEG